MAEKKNYKNELTWEIPEHSKPKRSNLWYVITGLLVFLGVFFCFFTISQWNLVFLGPNSNFLFALIIVISAGIMLIRDSQEPLTLNFTLNPEGVTIGKQFYDYDEFKHFAVIYKPKEDIKQLYFEFKNTFVPRLSIPLYDMDPLIVRNYLLKYLDEDLDRTDPPLSEQLTSILKL